MESFAPNKMFHFHCNSHSTLVALLWAYIGAVIRNASLVLLLTFLTKSQPPLAKAERIQPTTGENMEMALRMLLVACVGEAFALLMVQNLRGFATETDELMEMVVRCVTFIPHLFVFEVVFDFCHYAVHRLCHEVGWLYRIAHKLHHRLLHPTPLGTYMQDPLDVVLSNLLPLLVAVWAVPKFTLLQFHILMAYKSFVEIAGHTGKVSRSTSFPICPLLPTYFGMALMTADHDLHHTHSRFNYSKRFILWDLVFGTYKLPQERHIAVS